MVYAGASLWRLRPKTSSSSRGEDVNIYIRKSKSDQEADGQVKGGP